MYILYIFQLQVLLVAALCLASHADAIGIGYGGYAVAGHGAVDYYVSP